MLPIGELGLGYLLSRKIKEVQAEMESINLSTDAFEFKKRYNIEGRIDIEEKFKAVVSTQQTEIIIKALRPWAGKATGYEVRFTRQEYKTNFSVGGPRYVEKEIGIARSVEWHPKSLQLAVEISNALAKYKIAFYTTSRGGIRFYCPKDCYITNFYKTDNPARLEQLNAAKERSRQIREVKNRLDASKKV